jgi:hypothetical protein
MRPCPTNVARFTEFAVDIAQNAAHRSQLKSSMTLDCDVDRKERIPEQVDHVEFGAPQAQSLALSSRPFRSRLPDHCFGIDARQ